MPKREDNLLIKDMVEHIENIFEFVKNDSYDDFVHNKMKLLAVVRCFEVIGEASAMVSSETKTANPSIEWREIKDFRNKLIHDYFGVDYETVWQIIQNDLKYNYGFLKKM
jgi:uncharacterized protein with HEPN domain